MMIEMMMITNAFLTYLYFISICLCGYISDCFFVHILFCIWMNIFDVHVSGFWPAVPRHSSIQSAGFAK